jgi:acetyl-CoA C-acetyltransferase
MLDPRTPVIVGAAQLAQRPDDLDTAWEPVALMVQAVAQATDDAKAPALAAGLDLVGVVAGAWRYPDPGRIVAEAFGSLRARTLLTANGGNSPQSLLSHLAERIRKGELDSAVLVGAETIWSRRRLKRDGRRMDVTDQGEATPDERFQHDVAMTTEFERSRGLELPIHFYPIFESAIRASNGETIDGHRERLGRLWAGFNEVAVTNPNAWSRTPMTAEEIRTPGPDNRMVGFPYTKAMNSNWDLDQAAAVVLCSVERAEAAGVPRDRWIFPWAGAEAHDTPAVTNRRDLHSSPAIAEAGRALFGLTGVGPDEIDHVDLYSCFPSAVQIGAKELGFDLDRQLTQTGGLTFAGGPLNNYVTHSIATMVGQLRERPGTLGLVSANGGFVTKHSLGLYGSEPPLEGFRSSDVQDEVDKVPGTESGEDHRGAVTVEAYTVMHDGDGPDVGLCALQDPDQRRTWGRVTDEETLSAMMTAEAIGRTGHLDADGVVTLD